MICPGIPHGSGLPTLLRKLETICGLPYKKPINRRIKTVDSQLPDNPQKQLAFFLKEERRKKREKRKKKKEERRKLEGCGRL
jgi:hypothetical protein